MTAAARGWFNLLIASLVVVILARNIPLFLVAWEVMAVSSFLLIASGPLADTPEGQEGAWSYLIATHLGTACLLAMLPVLASPGTGELRIDQALDFDNLQPGRLTPLQTNVLFVLALAGFGTKAALAPFHAWVARAYRVAPAWVAAASSALMAKVSLYVLFRTILQLTAGHAPPAWWGLTLMGLGVLSGFLGMGGAIGATRIKVVLGYSSVENVGIICLGFGLGLLGISDGAPAIAVLGFGGALYHIINHAILKTLMFTATGLVEQNAGTDDLARLGGLLRRMPIVGTCVGIGALALSGLPALNAFASEWLIYRGLFRSVGLLTPANHVIAMATVAALALIGGLAAGLLHRPVRHRLSRGRAELRGRGKPASGPARATERGLVVGLTRDRAVPGRVPLVRRALHPEPRAGDACRSGRRPKLEAALESSFGPLGSLTVVSLLLIGTVVVLKRAPRPPARRAAGDPGPDLGLRLRLPHGLPSRASTRPSRS